MTGSPSAQSATPSPRDDRLVPTDWGYALFLLAGLPLCFAPIMHLPGMHLTFAPLLFLLATQRWGLARGLAAAVVFTAPAVWLGGSPIRPLIAVGQVLFVWWIQRRRWLMTEATALYDLLLLPLAGWVAVGVYHVSLLVLAQYLLAHLLMAATADVLQQNFTIARRAPFVVPRPSRSIEGSLHAMINFVVALLFCVALMHEAESVGRLEAAYRTRIRGVVAHMLMSESAETKRAIDRVLEVALSDKAGVKLYVSDRVDGFRQRAASRLGSSCRSFVGPDRSGSEIAYVTSLGSPCEIEAVHDGARVLMTAASFHDTLVNRYSWISSELIALFAAGLFAILYRISLTRALRQTIRRGTDTITRIGQPNLPEPAPQPFDEFDGPLRRFVALNNNYVAAVEERDRLVGVARGLKHSIDLRLMRDIQFDPLSGLLRFEEIRIGEEMLQRAVQIHAADHASFVTTGSSDEAIVEFRVSGTESLETYMVTLRHSTGTLRWESGIGIRLRQPQRLRELMLRQARLVDLGSMAASITHEIKQPLFTIAMAAESIHIILGKQGLPPDNPLERCADRIGLQVERAREIIRRISHYGHLGTLNPAGCDAVGAMEDARSFLQPMLDERGIAIAAYFMPGVHWVDVPRVALEQVMVNAIQNAADAVMSARESGHVAGLLTLTVARDGESIRCAVGDDGIGVGPGVGEAAFDAFFTTKSVDKGSGLGLFISRQIITDAGGAVALLPNEGDGATLLVTLPVAIQTAPLAAG